ncbi:MAG: hypothetical protein KGY70_10930 [Bacteroidales bacterium]|nr:hypothetical protein [Bacteroidales bacterium]
MAPANLLAINSTSLNGESEGQSQDNNKEHGFQKAKSPQSKKNKEPKAESPKIVNIVNFIRQCEPRIDWITEEVLYQTVVKQIEALNKHNLKGTFLLQYDALMDPRYQELLKDLPSDRFEIGAWWEIPQPLVENSGYEWRGRYPWDWHADVGFATGYTPEEREKLVDTYMEDFREIFGYYPRSVGSWFIDAHTLRYMYEEYGIVASANCKDQIGTDGYTLWGGYWNQGYYPSVKNAYMPAQNEENQIPVPIFRMLGSDPIHQYDNGLGGDRQRVMSLEPVYNATGGNPEWVKWYFDWFINGPSMEYAYTQAGQENSFTWKKMKEGYQFQLPLIKKLKEEGKLVVKNLGETGEWFKKNYHVTPPTSVTVLQDYSEKDLKTVWFNSRYYRANILWEDGTMRFRDIHIFDEKVESDYLTEKGTTTSCYYYTLPVVDGFMWSSNQTVAGLRLKALSREGLPQVKGGAPEVTDSIEGQLNITWPVYSREGKINVKFDESTISISSQGKEPENWFLELSYSENTELPIAKTGHKKLNLNYKGNEYLISAVKGAFTREDDSGLRIIPEDNQIILDLSK